MYILNNTHPWLSSYPPDVPETIDPDTYQSLAEVFKQSCERYSHLPAFYNLGTTITYRQLDAYSAQFAAYLQQHLKLKKGDRIALMMPNILQYPIAVFAAFRIGLIIVNVNPLYTADELTHQLQDAKATAIIVLAQFAPVLQKALAQIPSLQHVIVTKMGDMLAPIKGRVIDFLLQYIYKKIPDWHIPGAIFFKEAQKQGRALTLVPVPLHNQDIAFLQYTGGTTGIAKGAILTHRNMIANMLQAEAWFKSLLIEDETTQKREIIITALPLYHIFSLLANCLFFSKIGGFNILITNPRDIPMMVKEMKKFPFTAITAVNTLFIALLKNKDFQRLDFSHLKLSLGGGMAVQEAVAEKWQALTHAPLLEAYGLTEASPCVAINPPHLAAYNGSIGLPVPSTEICILDNNHQPLPFDAPGELAVKGPQVMQAYWHNPPETAAVFTKDGWLLTGDIATLDKQGFVRLLERKKDMIIVSGFNVYPNEIEGVLARLPGVREVAVVGVPDAYSGEVPQAFIVQDAGLLEGQLLTEADIIKYCKEHLTGYKVPKHIVFVEELPKTNVGKILRRALRTPPSA